MGSILWVWSRIEDKWGSVVTGFSLKLERLILPLILPLEREPYCGGSNEWNCCERPHICQDHLRFQCLLCALLAKCLAIVFCLRPAQHVRQQWVHCRDNGGGHRRGGLIGVFTVPSWCVCVCVCVKP